MCFVKRFSHTFGQGFDRLHVTARYRLRPCNPSHPFQVEGATGDYHTNLSAKKDALVKHLTPADSSYTFGFLHVKAVDDAGHDKNRELKVLSRLAGLNFAPFHQGSG
jgi:hypothetical protein